MIPYFDPKKFNSKSYSLNEKSDVYSIGVLLWELSSGIPPFCEEENDISLIYKILEGQREEIVPDTPIDYANLYTSKHSIYCKHFCLITKTLIITYFLLECWDGKPDNRPSMHEVSKRLETIISQLGDAATYQKS